jgi:hypothetical protein
MAYQLVEEVLDHAPADLDPAAVLVLVAIAELARAKTRSIEAPAATIGRRARLTEGALRKAFQRLEKAGIEVRVAIRMDRFGKPVYAVPGRHCEYKLPAFPAPKDCPCHRCAEAVSQDLLRSEEVPQGRGATPEGLTPTLEAPGGDPVVPPLPSGDPFGVSPDRTPSAARPRRSPEAEEALRALAAKLAGPNPWKQAVSPLRKPPDQKHIRRPPDDDTSIAEVIQMFPHHNQTDGEATG